MKAPDLMLLDWGIGGLSVYNEIRQRLPQLSILYFSDSGNTPYGRMSATALRRRVRQIILFHADRGIRHFVIACNAASTALPALQPEFKRRGLWVGGMIDEGIRLIARANATKVGVIGGARTIRSQRFTRPFTHSSPQVVGRIAQPLSALIEAGKLQGPEMDATLRHILKPLSDCQALVLACTHYPAAAPMIQSMLPGCRLLDPAKAVAQSLARQWRQNLPPGNGRQTFVTTGDRRQMQISARLAFGNRIASIASASPPVPRPA